MVKLIDRLGAFRNKAIDHEVAGETLKFYPPRMRMLLSGRMREIIDPISKAFSTILGGKERSSSTQVEEHADGSKSTFVQAINPDLARARAEMREERLGVALESLFNDTTRYQVGSLLADSLRDDFPQKEQEREKEVREFMDELDFPTFIQLLHGYWKALAPVLDKSGNSMFSGLREMVEREVKRSLRETQDGDGDVDEAAPSDSSGPRPMPPSESAEQS